MEDSHLDSRAAKPRVTVANGTSIAITCFLPADNALRRIGPVTPAEANVSRIGHFGRFRDQFQSTLWERVASLLQGCHMSKETA